MYNCCAISIHVSGFRDLWRRWASDKEQRLSQVTIHQYETNLFGSSTESSRHDSFAAMLAQQGTPLHIFFYTNGYDAIDGYNSAKGNGKIGFPPTEGFKEFPKIPASPNLAMLRCYSIILLLKFMLAQQGRYLIKKEETTELLTYERCVNRLQKEIKAIGAGFNDQVSKEGKEKKSREPVLNRGLRCWIFRRMVSKWVMPSSGWSPTYSAY